MSEINKWIRQYLLLSLSMAEHTPEYLDSYFGPGQILEEANANGKIALETILADAQDLIQRLHEMDQMDGTRKDFLSAQLRALVTTIRMEMGEPMTVTEKVENIYGFRPERVDEGEFEAAHRLLDGCLPGKGSIADRRRAYEEAMRIPIKNLESLCNFVIDELRMRTREHFGLPHSEQIELQFVEDRPYLGYCHYEGGGRSVLEINGDRPFYLQYLTNYIAHEVYPGHHTEFCKKDRHLIQDQDRQELWVCNSLSPQIFVSEMIAAHAREMVMPNHEFNDWLRNTLIPQSGLDVPELGDPVQLEKAWLSLAPVGMNAVFMHWDEGADDADLREYFIRYQFSSEEEATHLARWVMHPVFHVYTFSYYPGYRFLERALSRSHDPHRLFGRLLEETVLPSNILSW